VPERADITFPSDDGACAAWHYTGEGEAFAGGRGRPCVVMAPGFGGTRDAGFEPFAERFAAAGLDVLLFDYRTFGASPGEPRQLLSWRRHRRDYESAVAFARGLAGVDPDRIVLWGGSYAGGHAIAVAAEDDRVAAVIAQTPDVDALQTARQVMRTAGPLQPLWMAVAGLRDLVGSLLGHEPHMLPVVGEPGTLAAIATKDAMRQYDISGPTWRNEVCARGMLDGASNRSTTMAGRIRCPLLVQVAEFDDVTPPEPARKAAWKARRHGRPEVRSYPAGHFDVYEGETFERMSSDQLHFIRRHLAPQPAVAVAGRA
jgi:pimeloyl-ACP methyl ester carboxylesterase